MAASKRRVVALVRVSTDKQKRDQDLDYQRNQIRFTCKQFALDLAPEDEYHIDDVNGLTVRHTIQFDQIKRAVARPGIVGLVLPGIDRLARTTEFDTVADLLKPFKEILGGVNTKRIWTRKDELDITQSRDRDIIWQALRHAEDEREILKFRTVSQKDVLRQKRGTKMDKLPHWIEAMPISKQGKVMTYNFAYRSGFKKKIADACRRLLDGEHLVDIAEGLGYKTVNGVREGLKSEWVIGYKSRTMTRNERQWDKEKQKYKIGGRIPHEEVIRVQEIAEPAVTEDVWKAVLVKLNENSDRHLRRRKISKDFMATGLAHCGVCGEPMYHKLQHSRNHSGYFWCSTKAKKYTNGGKPDCGMGLIRADKIDDDINLSIKLYLQDRDYIEARLMEISDVEATAEKKGRIVRMEHELETLQQEKQRLVTAIRKGVLSIDDAQSDMKEINAKLDALNTKLRLMRDEIQHAMSDENRKQIAHHLAAEFADFPSMDPEMKVAMVQKYVRKIIIHRVSLDGSNSLESLTDDIYCTFEMKPGVLEMKFQTDPSESHTPARTPVKNLRGPVEPLRVKGEAIGGAPTTADEVTRLRSNYERRSTP